MEESESSMLEKSGSPIGTYILIGLLIILVVGGVYYFAIKTKSTPVSQDTSLEQTPSASGESLGASPSSDVMSATPSTSDVLSSAPALTIAMTGANYKFTPSTINVKVGQTVQVTLTSGDMPHDFVIDELGVKSDTVNKGESTTVTFTPDKAGTFEYFCSISNHRSKGMVGKLIVTE